MDNEVEIKMQKLREDLEFLKTAKELTRERMLARKRIYGKAYREKLKQLHGSTYLANKDSIYKYYEKVKEISGKYPSPCIPFRMKTFKESNQKTNIVNQ